MKNYATATYLLYVKLVHMGMNCYNFARYFQYLPCKTGILLYNKYIFAKKCQKLKKVTFMKQF